MTNTNSKAQLLDLLIEPLKGCKGLYAHRQNLIQRVKRMHDLEVRDHLDQLKASHFPGASTIKSQRARFLRNTERHKESETRIGCRSPVQSRIRRTAAVSNVIPWQKPCVCPTPFKGVEPWNLLAITCIGSADQLDAPL